MVLAIKVPRPVGQVIRERRIYLRMSQIQLAMRVSYPLFDIKMIEENGGPLVGDEVLRFAAALNMNEKKLCPLKED